tara:strand:- start:951 stop:1199 length:249 start_codon:yes stop_codon:yes gene_type:complete
MNTAKNAYDKILNGIEMYQRELEKSADDLDMEYLKDDPDKETIDCLVDEKNRIRSILFGLQLAMTITFTEAMKGREVSHESV